MNSVEPSRLGVSQRAVLNAVAVPRTLEQISAKLDMPELQVRQKLIRLGELGLVERGSVAGEMLYYQLSARPPGSVPLPLKVRLGAAAKRARRPPRPEPEPRLPKLTRKMARSSRPPDGDQPWMSPTAREVWRLLTGNWPRPVAYPVLASVAGEATDRLLAELSRRNMVVRHQSFLTACGPLPDRPWGTTRAERAAAEAGAEAAAERLRQDTENGERVFRHVKVPVPLPAAARELRMHPHDLRRAAGLLASRGRLELHAGERWLWVGPVGTTPSDFALAESLPVLCRHLLQAISEPTTIAEILETISASARDVAFGLDWLVERGLAKQLRGAYARADVPDGALEAAAPPFEPEAPPREKGEWPAGRALMPMIEDGPVILEHVLKTPYGLLAEAAATDALRRLVAKGRLVRGQYAGRMAYCRPEDKAAKFLAGESWETEQAPLELELLAALDRPMTSAEAAAAVMSDWNKVVDLLEQMAGNGLVHRVVRSGRPRYSRRGKLLPEREDGP